MALGPQYDHGFYDGLNNMANSCVAYANATGAPAHP